MFAERGILKGDGGIEGDGIERGNGSGEGVHAGAVV